MNIGHLSQSLGQLASFECSEDPRRNGKRAREHMYLSCPRPSIAIPIANGRPLADLEKILEEISRNLLVQRRRHRSR